MVQKKRKLEDLEITNNPTKQIKFTNKNDQFDSKYKEIINQLASTNIDLPETFGVDNDENERTNTFETLKTVLEDLIALGSKYDSTARLNDITFSDFLKSICFGLLKLPASDIRHELLNLVCKLDPIVMESISDIVLSHTIWSRCYGDQYDNLITSIFKVFEKLHRFESLISKMIRCIKDVPSIPDGFEIQETIPKTKMELSIGNILSESIIECFESCILSLSSWQIINVYKTLLFHIQETLDSSLSNRKKSKVYTEIISKLTTSFLKSAKVIDYTVTQKVIEKFAKTMEEHKSILGKFGETLINMEYDQVLMKIYLEQCYNFGELLLCFQYYEKNSITKSNGDLDYSPCDLTYLHPYLLKEQWCIISERVTNFGEAACIEIMQKMCIQKLYAIHNIEGHIDDKMFESFIHYFNKDHQTYLVSNNFALQNLIPKLSPCAVLDLVKALLKNMLDGDETCLEYINKSTVLSTTLFEVLTGKVVDLFKKVKKSHISNWDDIQITNDFESAYLSVVAKCFKKALTSDYPKVKINASRLNTYISLIAKLDAFLYSESTHSIYLFSFCSTLLLDLAKTTHEEERQLLKSMTSSIMMETPCFKWLKLDVLLEFMNRHFNTNEKLINHVYAAYLNNESNMKKLKFGVDYVVTHITSSPILLNSLIGKLFDHRKNKLTTDEKALNSEYLNDLFDAFINSLNSIEEDKLSYDTSYAYALKYYIIKNDEDTLNILKTHLNDYLYKAKFSEGWMQLCIIVAQNKTKFEEVNNNEFSEFVIKTGIENIEQQHYDVFSNLVGVIGDNVSDDKFARLANEIYDFIVNNNGSLKLWTTLSKCNLNPLKMITWQNLTEKLLVAYYSSKNDTLFELISNITQSVHFKLSATIIDHIFYTVDIKDTNVQHRLTIMKNLLKFRKPLLVQRLPSYLQRYTLLLREVCASGDSKLDLNDSEIMNVAHNAHQLEMLTNNIVQLEKHVSRISLYSIANILEIYERITLYPAVKMHINNCIYALISLCDQHAVSFLMRSLSTASTEMFKIFLETYKKYYKFTGKV